MKTNLFSVINRIHLVFLFSLLSILGWGQASITTLGVAVVENFNSYSGTSTLPANWTTSGTGTNGNAFQGTTQTTGTAGGWYGNTNMSYLGSGTASNGNATWRLQNNTGSTITSLNFSLVARMWKSGSNSPTVSLTYSTNSTGIIPAAGALTSVLTFNDATANISTGTPLSQTVGSLSIPNGDYIYIRFIHAGGGSSDNLGWDDVSVTASGAASSYSGVSAGAGVEPSTLSSLINTQASSVLNFDFTVTDDNNTTSGNDALPTLINQIIVPQGTGNDVSDWTQAIAGAVLTDGTNTITGTVNAANITFSGIPTTTSALGYVGDGASKTYTLKIWLNTTLGGTLPTTIDGLNLAFKVDRTNFTTASSATSTQFESGAGTAVESGPNNNAVTVVATKLAFVQQPSNTAINVNMSPSVTVSANDVNGNRDLDYVTSVAVTSTGSLSGSPVNVTPVSGLATYSALQHTATGTGLKLTAGSSSFTSVDSNTFNINLVSSATDYFRSKQTGSPGNWGTAASWESSSDNINWIDATLVPTSSATAITVRSGHTITVAAAATGKAITVESGGFLTLTSTLTVSDGTGTDLQINGTLNMSSGGTLTNNGTAAFSSTGVYNHSRSGGAIPIATWDVVSLCNVSGATSAFPANYAQTYGNFTWNGTSQSGNLTVNNNAFRVNGLFRLLSTNGGNTFTMGGTTPGTYANTLNSVSIEGGVFAIAYTSGVTSTTTVTNDMSISGTGEVRINGSAGIGTLNIGRDLLMSGSGYLILLYASTSPTTTVTVARDFILSGNSIVDLEYTNSSSGSGIISVGRNLTSTSSGDSTNGVVLDFGGSTITGAVSGNAINIAGNFSFTGTGLIQTFSENSPTGFVFNGSGIQTLTYTTNSGLLNWAPITINNGSELQLLNNITIGSSATNPAVIVNVNGILDFQNYTISAGTSTVPRINTSAGATLITSNSGGIGGTGTTGSLQNFNSVSPTSAAGRVQLIAGLNYTFNGVTTTPFNVNMGNPAIININANVTNNMSGITTTITNALNIAGGTTFTLNSAANSNLSLSNTSAVLNIASGGTFDNNGENYITSTGGAPAINIDGTFITRDAQGFTGTNTSIPSIIPTLGNNSIIEYGLNGNQAVTDFAYKNLTFSGGGTKTTTTISSITGTVTINSGVVVDADTKTFGGSGTNLTMLGTSKFITGGSGTKPDAQGTYSLAGASTIEFTGASATQIRLSPQYANIIVSGTNVVAGTTTNGGLTFQNGGHFTVRNGARFKVNNDNGFSGAATTAIKNTNNPTITLDTGSTIDYTGADQIVTNNLSYENLAVSTAGTKTAATGNLTVNNLTTVSSGTLKISETADNTTSNVLYAHKGIANTGGTVSFGSNAQLMQDDDAVNTGNIKSSRKAKLPKMGYTYWSSPVTSQNLYAFSNGGQTGGTPKSRFFVYDEATDTFKNTGAFLLNDSSVFETGKGYAIRGMDNFTTTMPTTSYEFIFAGVPHNAGLSFSPLKWTSASKGYNLIGNPYPSNINFDDLYASNSTKMYATAYFWTNNDMTVTQQQGSGYSGNNYAIYNLTGGTPAVHIDGAPDQPSLASITPNNIIKVGQGFIIKTKQAGGGQSLGFSNSVRLTDNGTFFNNKNNTEKDRFWLRLVSPSNISNVILIGYIPGATNGYEIDFDGELFIIGSDSFYSLLDSKKLAIQGKASFDIDDKVGLGNVYSQNGNYKISIANKEGIFGSSQNIYLKDKLLNKIINLSNEDYIFQATKGTDITRFEIVYKDEAVLNTGSNSKSDFIVYKDGNNQVIKSSKKLGEIKVFDVSGKLIKSLNTNDLEVRIDMSAFLNGVYILKVENSGDIKTKKIIK